jgi:hypothetical protein
MRLRVRGQTGRWAYNEADGVQYIHTVQRAGADITPAQRAQMLNEWHRLHQQNETRRRVQFIIPTRGAGDVAFRYDGQVG